MWQPDEESLQSVYNQFTFKESVLMFFLPPKNSFEIHNYFIITCDQNTVLTTSFQLLADCFKM